MHKSVATRKTKTTIDKKPKKRRVPFTARKKLIAMLYWVTEQQDMRYFPDAEEWLPLPLFQRRDYLKYLFLKRSRRWQRTQVPFFYGKDKAWENELLQEDKDIISKFKMENSTEFALVDK